MQIRTLQAQTYSDIDSGETLLQVPWEIYDGDTVLFSASQSFPLTATADEIKAFLAQCLQTHTDDVARHADAQVAQTGLDNAAAVASEISNISL